MASLTSKGLAKADPLDLYDVDVFHNPAMDRLNTYAMGAVVCTTTTRPAGVDRWDGQLIWQTDTRALGVYDASVNLWRHFDTVWQTFTPVVYFSGVTLTIGNGTLKGVYLRTGRVAKVRFTLTIGTTTNFNGGSGVMEVGAPFQGAPIAEQAFPSAGGPIGQFQGVAGTGLYSGNVLQGSDQNKVSFELLITGTQNNGNLGAYKTLILQASIPSAGCSMTGSYDLQMV